jgi:hypothetical protein
LHSRMERHLYGRLKSVTTQRILTLHGIGTPHHGVADDERFYSLSREAFLSLLQTIVVTRERSNLSVAITFDDGNVSDALIALPGLAKRNLKAIFCRCRKNRLAPLPRSSGA